MLSTPTPPTVLTTELLARTGAPCSSGGADLGEHLLYNSNGPNPHVVRMFLAEKGLLDAVPQQQVDIREGENREPPYVTEVNTRGQCPALRLPGGDVLCEILAICEYIEELAPCAPSPAPRILSPTDTQALSVCPVVGAGLRR